MTKKKVVKKTVVKLGAKGTAKKPKAPMFQAILSVNKTEIKAEGKDIIDAFDKLESPVSFKTYGVLSVKKGKTVSGRKILKVADMRRFFTNQTLRRVKAKQFGVYF